MRHRFADWIRRYGFAELVGTASAIAGSIGARAFTGSEIAAAYGGAVGESLGFYSTMLVREFRAGRRQARAEGRAYSWRDASRASALMAVEFGPAEVADTGVLRPLAIGLGTRWLGHGWGVVVGKLAADIVFYVPVIVTYEMRRRLARRRSSTDVA